jgi:hypothetical protein
MGSTLSPDEDVQEGAKKVLDSYVVPVVPIIATLGQHDKRSNPTTTSSPRPIQSVSLNTTTQPSKTSAIQKKATKLASVADTHEKAVSKGSSTTQESSSTPSKRTDAASSPGQGKSSRASSDLHSVYPIFQSSPGEDLDELSTCAVGGDTSITSLSTGVCGEVASRSTAAAVEYTSGSIFIEEDSGTHHGRDTALAAGEIAGSATAAAVAMKERDKRDGQPPQCSTSPGSPKSNRFSTIRKLTKGGRHSRSGSASEPISSNRSLAPVPAGAAFPETTYVIEDHVDAPKDLTNDPLLAPLPVSHGDSGVGGPTPTPATVAADSPEHKPNKLTKKPSPTASAPPRVSDASTDSSPDAVGTSAGQHGEGHAHKAPMEVAESSNLIFVNGSHTGAHKPKLMDRIKGEVKIMHGTLRGDEAKKIEGRMLKEFGSV